MSDNHILTPKVDLIMAMDDLRLNGCNHSADLFKKAIFTTPVSVEPVNWPAVEARISEFVNEYEMVGEDEQGRDGHYTPNESERALILGAMHGVLADDELMALLRPAAPVAAQGHQASADGELIGKLTEAHKTILGSRGFLNGNQYISVSRKKWYDLGVAIEAALAALAQQPVSGADDIEFLVRVLEQVSAWLPEDWSEFLERNPAVVDMLRPMVNHQTQQDADKVDAGRWRHFMNLLDAMGDDDDPDAPGFPARLHAAFQEGSAATIVAIDAARKEQA